MNKPSLETRILAIFRKLLKIRNISPNTDFFMLGGDSLKSVELQAFLNRDLGGRLNMTQIYKNPTPQGLAKLLKEERNEKPV